MVRLHQPFEAKWALDFPTNNLQGLSPKALKFWTNIILLKLEKATTKYKKKGIFLVAVFAQGVQECSEI